MCECEWDPIAYARAIAALPKREQDRIFAELLEDLRRSADLIRRLQEEPVWGANSGPITIPISYV